MAGASTTPKYCTWRRRELGGDGGLNSLGKHRDLGSIKDSQAWRKQSSRLLCYWHSAIKTGWLPTLAPQIWHGAGQELQCDTVCWWKIQKGIILPELSVSCNFLQRSTSIFLALVKLLPPLLLGHNWTRFQASSFEHLLHWSGKHLPGFLLKLLCALQSLELFYLSSASWPCAPFIVWKRRTRAPYL